MQQLPHITDEQAEAVAGFVEETLDAFEALADAYGSDAAMLGLHNAHQWAQSHAAVQKRYDLTNV